MKRMLLSLIAVAFASVVFAQEPDDALPEGELRQWSDTTGKFQIDAKFVEMANSKVTLQRADGSTLEVPLTRLSARDRKFVRAEMGRRRDAAWRESEPPEEIDKPEAGNKQPEQPKLNDRGLGILPLEKPQVFIHVEGMPAPQPEACVRSRWTDAEKDAQLLIDIESERLKTAGQRHQELEKKFAYGLTRVETHHLVVHAQLPPAEARKVGLALEALKVHTQRLSGNMVLSPLRPENDEMIIALGKDHYLRLLKIIAVEKEGQLGDDWHLMPDLMGGTVGNTSVAYVLPNALFLASHMAVNQAAGRSMAIATKGRGPAWLFSGFASYCENVVLGKNYVQTIKYELNAQPIGPNWAVEAKRIALARQFKTWDKVLNLDLRDFQGADYVQAYAMVAYLYQSDSQKFHDLLEGLAAGGEVGESIENAYGQPITKLQQAWLQWLVRG